MAIFWLSAKILRKMFFQNKKKNPSGWGVKASPISPCMHPAQRGTVAQQTRLKPSNSVVTEKWGSSLLRLFDFLLHWTNCIVRYWKWLYVVQAKKKLPEERLRPTKGRKHRWQYRQQSAYSHIISGQTISTILALWVSCPWEM